MVLKEGVWWVWGGEGRALGLDMIPGFRSLCVVLHPSACPRVSSQTQPALLGYVCTTTGPCASHTHTAVDEFWSPHLVLTTLLCPQILRDTFTESCTRISQEERHKMKGFLGMGPQSWGVGVGPAPEAKCHGSKDVMNLPAHRRLGGGPGLP